MNIIPKNGIPKIVAASIVATVAMPLFADDEHIYCTYSESQSEQRRAFYTAVFRGDYSFTVGFTNDFHDYLEEKYDFNGYEKYCFFKRDASSASRDLDERISDDERSGVFDGGVIKTNWAPDSFSDQPLQDFNIAIDGDSAELKICVRDHECEDGDKVRISMDGSRVFSGEIDNDWDCSEYSVQAGRDYAIELFAINGTGNKGSCSHANVNTGEIRIQGANSQTQSWQHRGGAGSRAQIKVKTQ